MRGLQVWMCHRGSKYDDVPIYIRDVRCRLSICDHADGSVRSRVIPMRCLLAVRATFGTHVYWRGSVTYDEWELRVPEILRLDPIWKTKAYRLAAFMTELVQQDLENLGKHVHLRDVIPQLYESIGSIGTSIAEGYSRQSGKDRARIFEYALGSAREARHWYYAARVALSASELHARLEILDEAIRLLVTMVTRQRAAAPYRASKRQAG